MRNIPETWGHPCARTVDEERNVGDCEEVRGITLCIRKYPLTWCFVFAKVCLVPVSAAPTGAERASLSRTSFGADREGKRARSTRCKRLREGREATASERRAPGDRSGERRSNATSHRASGSPMATEDRAARTHRTSGSPLVTGERAARTHRVAGSPAATGDRATGSSDRGGTPTAPAARRHGGVHDVWHGQPGQRERRRACEPGSPGAEARSSSSVRRGGVIGSEPGSPGHRVKTGIARRAFGHDGRCEVERRLTPEDRPVVDRPTFRVAPGGCAGASWLHRPGLFTVLGRRPGGPKRWIAPKCARLRPASGTA